LESLDEIENDLFDVDFRNSFNFQFRKGPLSDYNSNPLKKRSLRKHPYSYVGHWKEFKDGISSDAIEGEPSHLEANPIFSPSMPILDVLSGPISQPILDSMIPLMHSLLSLMMTLEIH
jgi:hypothetical protein